MHAAAIRPLICAWCALSPMPNYYDETTALNLLRHQGVDACIEYCLPCVEAQMTLFRRVMPAQTRWDDLHSDLQLYLVLAVQRFRPSKGAKLFTWLTNYFRYARLDFTRRETRFFRQNVQLEEGAVDALPRPEGLAPVEVATELSLWFRNHPIPVQPLAVNSYGGRCLSA